MIQEQERIRRIPIDCIIEKPTHIKVHIPNNDPQWRTTPTSEPIEPRIPEPLRDSPYNVYY